jgi:hypothetical protein
MDEASWNEALVRRAQEAEAKFARGDKVNEEDMVVIAMIHPDKFDIQVKLKED